MRSIVFFFAWLSLSLVNAQGELPSKIEGLIDLIGEVQSGRDLYQQSLTYEEDTPYRLQLFITEIDHRGNEETREYQINLALLDPNLVRWSDGRDRIEVNLRSGRDPVIKVFEDGELDGYESGAAILATDVDNARAIEAALKEIIPLAQTAWEADTALPEDYDALKAYVAENIKDVIVDDNRYEQLWVNADDHPNRVHFTKTKAFFFNLADIHAPGIEIGVRGMDVIITLPTSKGVDFIRVLEDGEPDDYTDEVEVYCAEVDEARVLAYALRNLVPMAQEAEEALLPALETPEAALSLLRESLSDFKVDETTYRQTLEGDCAATYTRVEDDGSEAEEEQYIFNFADLQSASVEINVSGTEIAVEGATAGGQNFIYLSEDGEQQNYSDELSFALPDIPTAKLFQHALKAAIDQCPEEIAPAAWEDIKAAIDEIETVSEELFQSVELIDGETCKWDLLIQEAGGRTTKEERYEINLYDLDARRMELEVRGKDVSVNLFTARNDEIIKNYTDGEELGYVDEVSFRVKDIATAKAVIAGLQVMIEGCQ